MSNTGWTIKVPIDGDELYVLENQKIKLYETKQQAEQAAKIWKQYRIVYYAPIIN